MFFNLTLIIIINGNVISAQTTPAVRVKANEFDHNPSITSKDWIWSIFEDDKGSFISAGYARSLSTSGTQSIHPSLVKVDKDLESVWHKDYSSGEVMPGFQRSFGWGYFAGLMKDAIQYTDPDDNQLYYVAVGYTYITGKGILLPSPPYPPNTYYNGPKLIIVKTDRYGNVVPGFPKIYMNTPGTNDTTTYYYRSRKGHAIVYSNTDPAHFYIAGSEDGAACIFRLNENLDINSLTALVTLPPVGPVSGELNSICLGYPVGSDPKGNPIGTGANLIPTHVWATGTGADPSNPLDQSIIITRWEITSITPFAGLQTVFENAPSPPSPNAWETGGSPWGNHTAPWYEFRKDIGKAICKPHFRQRTGVDFGTGIRQLNNGNIIVTGMANLIFDNDDPTDGICMNTAGNNFTNYWRDADAFARLIDQTSFPNAGLNTGPGLGGYEINCRHIGHYSGMEYAPKVRQDENGDLYFIGSNGDPGTVQTDGLGNDLLTNFYVIKTDKDLNPLWNQTYRSEEANEASCGFGVDICRTGELVVAGDNKKENDNYDFIKIGNCETNRDDYDYVATDPNIYDDVTISTFNLLGGTNGTLNITSNKKLKGYLLIENACTVKVSNGAILEFADMDRLNSNAVEYGFEFGVVIQPGGKLKLENGAILTSLSGCDHKWRGVQVQASSTPDQTNASTIGILEMTNSKIMNATCGVTLDGGGLITCSNTKTPGDNNLADLDMVNFLNNRKGVAFSPFYTENLSRFNFTNFSFESPAAVKDFEGIGLNTHCSMYGVDKIIFNGCSFKNSFTGPYVLGIGLASFDATFHVLRGNDEPSLDGCSPIGKITQFENLTYGILSDGTPYSSPISPANFIGVGEAKFKNCGISWQCDNEVAPLSYKNTFDWDDDLGNYPISTFCKGIYANNTDQIKIHENTFSTDDNYSYTLKGIILDNTAAFPYTSTVRKNIFQNISTTNNQFYRGVYTLGDNFNFELRCNEFIDIAEYDWQNYGDMQNQGSPAISFANTFSFPCASSASIHSPTSNPFTYQDVEPRSSSNICETGGVLISSVNPAIWDACPYLNPCDVYIHDGFGPIIFEFDNIETPAMREEGVIWSKIKDKDYSAAQHLTNNLPNGDYKTLFTTILSIIKEKRFQNPTHAELLTLKTIAKAQNDASIDARHFLSFFMEILVMPDNDSYLHPSANKLKQPAKPIALNKEIEKKFRIYPNPTHSVLNIELDNSFAGNTVFEITDLTGKIIFRKNNLLPNSTTPVDMRHQVMGVYFYKLYSDNGFFKSGKIVISR